ncbi:hypothetical protein L6164_013976 [Bauhinia variegata]|uniref:Uncharacterized protein n=1 Tax=Bauhinia variegata TaxID=167791 RepID=A0ACB9NHJ9_BAUVA|nr:hypothetical protein L6164_013976 [Bauhinia variegata]
MRLPELIFLFCLLFLATAGSNAVARRTYLLTNLFDAAKKRSTNEVAGEHADECKSKSFRFGHYLSCPDSNTTTSDDKRLVPTGPNPLHNR